MKIPVGHKNNKWKVVFKPVVEYEGEQLAGLCDHHKKTLFISTNYPKEMSDADIKEQISISYWHEWLHAVFYNSDIRDLSYWNIDTEHTIIMPLAKALAVIMPVEIDLIRD